MALILSENCRFSLTTANALRVLAEWAAINEPTGSGNAYLSDNVMTLFSKYNLNPLNPELNPIYNLLALLAHHFLHVSRISVKSLTLRLLMSYIYIYIYIYDISSLRVNG